MKSSVLLGLAFAILLVCSDRATAQIPVTHVTVDPAASAPGNPWGKAVGDINGDGKIDLVTGGRSSGGLVWYENPSWQKRSIVNGGSHSTDREVIDLDSDGDNDVVSITTSAVLWYENLNGLGTSWATHSIFNITQHDVEVGDLDADGKIDVITRNQGSFGSSGETVNIFRQNTPTSWSRIQVSVPDGEGLKLADVDLDDRPDIIVNQRWYRNSGDISTWSGFTYTSSYTHEPTFIAFQDINGDGRGDLLLSPAEHSGESYRISWFEHPGDATAIWTEHIIENNAEAVLHYIDAADFDKDGDKDVLTAEMHQGSDPDEVKIYFNSSAGSSWSKQVVSTNGSHSMRIFDADNDGDVDFYGANHGGSAPIELWLNRIDLAFPLDQWSYKLLDNSRERFSGGNAFFGVAFGDLSNDGHPDIVSGKYFYRNPAGDITEDWTRITFPANVDGMLIINVDHDEFGDVIATALPNVYWLEATDTSGNSWDSTLIGTLPETGHINGQGYALGQIKAGGRPEVALAAGDGVYYFEIPVAPANPAAGNWPKTKINSGTEEGIAFGDIDRDGDLDMAGAISDGTGRVGWWENPGDGSANWTLHEIGTLPGRYADRFAVVDINKNNRLDIVVSAANGSSNGIFWFEQPPALTSSWTRRQAAALDTTNGMDVGDFDADGDIDILAGEHRGAKRSVILENVNNGTSWNQHVVDTGKESHLGTRVFDLDNDSDLDIVSIAWDSFQEMHLWRNNAVSTTSLPTVVAPVLTPNGGVFQSAVDVSLSTSTNGAEIRYTLNGTPPDINSTLYSVPIRIAQSATLRTRAFLTGLAPSPVVSAAYVIGVSPTDGLAAHWSFDEGAGPTAFDHSGNGHLATLQGPAWDSAGKLGSALRFDGADDFVDTGTLDVSGEALTLAAWVNSDNLASCASSRDCRIISKANGTSEQDHYWMISTIAQGSATRLRLRLKTGGSTSTLIASSGDLAAGNWHHVAAVYTGSQMQLYLDGSLVGTSAKTGSLSTSATTAVNIGRNPDGYGEWQGLIDDVRIYSRALSLQEIALVMAGGGSDNIAPARPLNFRVTQ